MENIDDVRPKYSDGIPTHSLNDMADYINSYRPTPIRSERKNPLPLENYKCQLFSPWGLNYEIRVGLLAGRFVKDTHELDSFRNSPDLNQIFQKIYDANLELIEKLHLNDHTFREIIVGLLNTEEEVYQVIYC